MNLRTLAIILALGLLGAFTLLNWAAITTPTTLSLGFAEVQAPLGLVLLMVSALLAVIFLAYIVFQQAGVILETRRSAKELKAQRELADRAEASRFTELRTHLSGEIARLEARLDRVDAGLQERLAESTRSLSAYVGEIDDKLDRLFPPQREP